MAAPLKTTLQYYSWDCNAHDIGGPLEDLSDDYGPLGETIYRRMLDLIYSNGFYYESNIDKLSRTIRNKIGKEWVKREKCKEILTYCTDIGLFDKSLVECNIWTSRGIQKRYFEIMKQLKRVVDVKHKEYLLVDVVLIMSKSNKSSEETWNNSEETGDNSEETGVNSGKGNKNRINQNELNHSKEDSKDLDASDLPTIIENIEVAVGRKLNEIERSLILNDINNKRDIDVARFFFAKTNT